MTFRSISIATGIVAAAALVMGCEGEKPAAGTGKTGSATTAKPMPTPAVAATATATAKATAKPAVEGKGTLKGVIAFSGKAPVMKEPKKRKDADVCKDAKTPHNAVLVKDGKLADVFVAIGDGQITGEFTAAKPAEVHQTGCVYVPRIQGILPGQELSIFNDDATLHNVHAYHGADSPINQAQPKGAAPLKTTKFEEPGVYRLQCDVHPWMRSFAIASDNPYFAVSAADGSFTIEKVPAGKYKIVAWHSIFGKLEKADVEVKDGAVDVAFEFKGTEAEPAENAGEMKDLF